MNEEERIAHREKLNCFCFMCGKFTPKEHRRKLNGQDAVACYNYYFSMTLAEMQNVDYAPEFTCITCLGALNSWWKQKRYSLPFGIPMVWTNPGEHVRENCYACSNDKLGLNRNSKFLLGNEDIFIILKYINLSKQNDPVLYTEVYQVLMYQLHIVKRCPFQSIHQIPNNVIGMQPTTWNRKVPSICHHQMLVPNTFRRFRSLCHQ